MANLKLSIPKGGQQIGGDLCGADASLLNPRFRDVELLRHLLERGGERQPVSSHIEEGGGGGQKRRKEEEGYRKRDGKRKRGTERCMVRGREGEK